MRSSSSTPLGVGHSGRHFECVLIDLLCDLFRCPTSVRRRVITSIGGHCKRAKPEYDAASEAFADNKKLVH